MFVLVAQMHLDAKPYPATSSSRSASGIAPWRSPDPDDITPGWPVKIHGSSALSYQTPYLKSTAKLQVNPSHVGKQFSWPSPVSMSLGPMPV